MAARLSADWQQTYGHPLYWLETFTDPTRCRGTCYRAANWIPLGRTQGRGHRAPHKRPTRSDEFVQALLRRVAEADVCFERGVPVFPRRPGAPTLTIEDVDRLADGE